VKTPPKPDITTLLRAWTAGNRRALDELLPIVYEELRQLAHARMQGERHGDVLQTTALVNEAYLRLVDIHQLHWQDRAHFFAVSAELMRRILVDQARARACLKRGGGTARISLEECATIEQEREAELLDLDDALRALEKLDERKGRIVNLRFFGGLTVEETAAVLDVSPQTVHRDWKLSKAWLTREMSRARKPA
jgi:RNA polymerase sigma factor (TIGR02999 family)